MNNIVIVGAGTTGWSAAALLSKNKNFNITIIEPTDIPTIGVGESTIPYINVFHDNTELEVFNTSEWLDKVDGTLKFSIEFADYDAIGSKWIHPFLSVLSPDRDIVSRTCSSDIPLGIYRDQPDFVNDNFVLPNLITKRFIKPKPNEKAGSAGYHINAVKYAQLLKEQTLKRKNVICINNSVSEILLDNTNIDKLILNDNTIIQGDLFIDCTGFKGLLIEKVNSKWDNSYSNRLFVDKALAVQLPYNNKLKQQRNTTYCHALGNGWVWNVPLQERIGTGYVFSSRHTSDEDALEEFKEHLSSMYGYNKDDIHPRTVPFKVGIRPESWKNNVVAIGLSSFFLEPIESTAIATMHYQIETIYNMITNDHILMKDKIKKFNYTNKLAIDSIASYIELHYMFSKRDDTKFWRDFTSLPLTDIQQSVLDLYVDPNKELVSQTVKACTNGHSLFDQSSFMFLYLGFGISPNSKNYITN
jgi:tryptophan 6-halogenase